MPELHLPWLECAATAPLLCSLILLFVRHPDRARAICLAGCTAALICSLGEWADFESLDTFEARDRWDTLQTHWGVEAFVIDEFSAPLPALTALLFVTTVATTLKTKIRRFPFAATMFSESVLLTASACRDPRIIVGLMVISCFPPWFELRRRGRHTGVFIFHMGLSAGLMIAGLLTAGTSYSVILLTIGALIRCGIWPAHCWMTDLFEKASFGTALLFVTPMIGAYSVMRLVLPSAPIGTLRSIAVLSLITAVYAAGMALVQKDTRRFFCFLFLSNSALVLSGLELGTPLALAGGLCVWLSAGISLHGFGVALRCAEARTGRLTLNNFHGLGEHTPFLSGMFLVTGLASIGFPGTVGFIGMELLIEGAVGAYPVVGLAVVIAAALNGIAVLKAYFHVFTGTRHVPAVSMACRSPERLVILVFVGLIIGGGLIPQPGIRSRYHAAEAVLEHRRTTPPAAQINPPTAGRASLPEVRADVSQNDPSVTALRRNSAVSRAQPHRHRLPAKGRPDDCCPLT